MTDVCPKCGREIDLEFPDTYMFACGVEGGETCRLFEDAYQRGRRDGIDEGVKIAKMRVVVRHYMQWPEGEWTNVSWSKVDAEAEKAKERT